MRSCGGGTSIIHYYGCLCLVRILGAVFVSVSQLHQQHVRAGILDLVGCLGGIANHIFDLQVRHRIVVNDETERSLHYYYVLRISLVTICSSSPGNSTEDYMWRKVDEGISITFHAWDFPTPLGKVRGRENSNPTRRKNKFFARYFHTPNWSKIKSLNKPKSTFLVLLYLRKLSRIS